VLGNVWFALFEVPAPYCGRRDKRNINFGVRQKFEPESVSNTATKTVFTATSGVPRNSVRGGEGSTNSVEDREKGDLGAAAP